MKSSTRASITFAPGKNARIPNPPETSMSCKRLMIGKNRRALIAITITFVGLNVITIAPTIPITTTDKKYFILFILPSNEKNWDF